MLDASEAELLVQSILGHVDEFVSDETLIVEALGEAVRLGHPLYDMLYYTLARRTASILFTCDVKLLRLCERTGVNCMSLVKL